MSLFVVITLATSEQNLAKYGVRPVMTKLIKADQVAERLSVAPATIRKWIHFGWLPVVRLGRSVRVREEDCDALARFGGLPQKPTNRGHLFLDRRT